MNQGCRTPSARVWRQADGKIVVAGRYGNNRSDFALARYNTDGSLDTSFDGDGKLTTVFVGNGDEVSAVAIQTDGKIVVAGYGIAVRAVCADFTVVRYNSDGSLDTSFDSDGVVTTDFNSGSDGAFGMALQADGKIVVAGTAEPIQNGDNDFAVARYNTDGSLDTSFDEDGKLTTDFQSLSEESTSVAIQGNGKIRRRRHYAERHF